MISWMTAIPILAINIIFYPRSIFHKVKTILPISMINKTDSYPSANSHSFQNNFPWFGSSSTILENTTQSNESSGKIFNAFTISPCSTGTPREIHAVALSTS